MKFFDSVLQNTEIQGRLYHAFLSSLKLLRENIDKSPSLFPTRKERVGGFVNNIRRAIHSGHYLATGRAIKSNSRHYDGHYRRGRGSVFLGSGTDNIGLCRRLMQEILDSRNWIEPGVLQATGYFSTIQESIVQTIAAKAVRDFESELDENGVQDEINSLKNGLVRMQLCINEAELLADSVKTETLSFKKKMEEVDGVESRSVAVRHDLGAPFHG